MESNKIEALLEIYFEGNTTLQQEKILRDYFNNETIAPNLEDYKSMFAAFKTAKLETSKTNISISKKESKTHYWKFGIAALLMVSIGVTGFFLSQNGMTNEEKEALAAFQKTKETMYLLSTNLNQGAEKLSVVSQFTITKNKILK